VRCTAAAPLQSLRALPGPSTPRVIRAVEDLFLFSVAIDCRPDGVTSPDKSDYFAYRAGNGREPSLQRLLRPHPFFQDDDVGLLSRGANYTVAALTAVPSTEWVLRKVSVTQPQQRMDADADPRKVRSPSLL
jgi:hypothetical protein